jgi:hypothetical protein
MQNLIKVFDFADREDIKIAEVAWTKMNKLTADIAQKHGFSPRIGAAVFAALSPNNDFKGNLRDTDRLLLSARRGLGIDDFKVSTYGNNKRKAWRIAHGGEEPLDLIVFPKTRNFFINVSTPEDDHAVTIDGHIFNCWRGERIALKGAAMKMNAKIYEEVANDVRALAKMKGLLPNVVQGILWYAWKRQHRILYYQEQFEFWDQEAIAANLGFVPPITEDSLPDRTGT